VGVVAEGEFPVGLQLHDPPGPPMLAAAPKHTRFGSGDGSGSSVDWFSTESALLVRIGHVKFLSG